MSYDIYTGLLKAFSLPTLSADDVSFSYVNNHEKFETLKESYPIEEVAGTGNDLSKAINLLQWVSSNIYHKGDGNTTQRNALDLLEYSFKKEKTFGINCVGLARVLAECLLAIGLKARPVFIMPCSPYDGDNHVVTHVYIRELGKWVVFDPTFNAYFSNASGEYLGLFELRNHLANQEPVFFNDEAKYNDDEWTEESAKENIEYFAKNLFYFQTAEISTFGADVEGNRFITLCPNGYDPKLVRISNIEYRIKKYGDSEWMQNWLKNEKEGKYIFCSTVNFD